MNWDTLEAKIKSIRLRESPGLTLVLGAGIHQMSSLEGNPLASWSELLDSVSNHAQGAMGNISPSLYWELVSMSSKSPEQMGHEGERSFRARLREKIQELELEVVNLRGNSMNPIFEILDSGMVSDVVSLNLDLVLERLYAERQGQNLRVQGKGRLFRFREIESEAGNVVRFWHPHGDTDSLETMQMGMWEYQKQLPELRRRFNQIKAQERRLGHKGDFYRMERKANNWFELMLFRPVVFAGTSLDPAEWDIWFSILMRWRNRGRLENPFGDTWRLAKDNVNSAILGGTLPKEGIGLLLADEWSDAWCRLVKTFKN